MTQMRMATKERQLLRKLCIKCAQRSQIDPLPEFVELIGFRMGSCCLLAQEQGFNRAFEFSSADRAAE